MAPQTGQEAITGRVVVVKSLDPTNSPGERVRGPTWDPTVQRSSCGFLVSSDKPSIPASANGEGGGGAGAPIVSSEVLSSLTRSTALWIHLKLQRWKRSRWQEK